MPQGKGTYGKQVGRPPKNKYYGGGSVDPFSTKNPEGVPAEQVAEAMEKQNMAKNMEESIPTTNAMDRSQTMPDTEQYKEGGKIDPITKRAVEKVAKKALKGKGKDITDVVKSVKSEKKAEALRKIYRRALKGEKGMT